MKSDMTEGSIEGHLARFAIPLILGNMFQLTYNAADSIYCRQVCWKQSKHRRR